MGRWIKLYKEDLCNLYSPPNIIRMIKMRMILVGHVAPTGEKRNMYRLFGEKARPQGRPRDRQVNNIQMG
jgi:hypothetical protein